MLYGPAGWTGALARSPVMVEPGTECATVWNTPTRTAEETTAQAMIMRMNPAMLMFAVQVSYLYICHL
jgi:hypothetical protein